MRRDMYEEFSREIQYEMGLQPEQLEAMVRAFGKNVSFSVEMFPNQLIPALMVFIDVEDENMVRGMLSAMETDTGAEWKEIKARRDGEVPLRYTQVDMDGFAMRPGYAFRDGQLIIGSDVTKLRSAMRRPGGDDPTIKDVGSFQDAMQRFSGASIFVHSRMDRAAEMGWPMAEGPLRGLLDGQEGEEMGLSSDILPSVEELAAALGAATFATTMDASGLRIEQQSNLGLATMLCLVGLGAVKPSTR